MPPGDAIAWHRRLAADEGLSRRRLAAVAAGAIGDPQLVPWLIEQMSDDANSRSAGEAFSMITGVDIAYEDLEREAPADVPLGPSESPADEDVAMDPDEDLPFADPELVRAWWERHGNRFPAGTRHLLGRPISEASLQVVLREGQQRQRAAAALELALSHPGQPLFEVRERADRQRRLLRIAD
jgi:uncharacterized protein (TIGR02270 family)